MLLSISCRLTGNKPLRSLTYGIYNISKCACNIQLIKRYIHVYDPFENFAYTCGREHIQSNRLNKDLAFSMKERFSLGIHGLLPPSVKTLEKQVEMCKIKLDRYSKNLNKYLFLMGVYEQNEKLFFRLLNDYLEELLPIVYTPTVGDACLHFSEIYKRLNALFITINDKGYVYDIVKNWPEHFVRAIVVTDGERILGLGDLGLNGVCIPVGKMCLYTILAGVKPHMCMPVILDVGTNNEALLRDPLYVGIKEKRITGKDYDNFIDEFLKAVVRRFGQMVVVQFEDFATANALNLLDKYRNRYRVFNDDIQGTAGIVVAGLLTSKRILGKKVGQHKYLFLGAGGAATGIADLLVRIMRDHDGLSLEEATNLIWMFDVHGLLTKERPGGVEKAQLVYAKDHAPTSSFLEIIKEIQPSVLIGASTAGGAFTREILQTMATFNERPIIFALSNPTIKSECTPEEAYTHTDGRAIYASGSPYPAVTYNNQLYKPRQSNNAYIFPGVALGIIMSGIRHVDDDVIILAAQTIADVVTENDLKYGSLYPSLSTIRQLSLNIATRIFQYATDMGLSTVYPNPPDKEAYIRSYQYSLSYEQTLPNTWVYPRPPDIQVRPLDATTI